MTNYAKHETEEKAAIARDCLRYDPDTGDIIRIKSNYPSYIGKNACIPTSNGRYFIVKINRRYYMAHRIAWLLFYGKWPKLHLDHEDGNGLNNKISNLMQATPTQNARNRKRQASVSGHTGIDWNQKIKKWTARIKFGGKPRHLGCFSDITGAIEARRQAQIEYGFHANHGQVR